MKDPGRIDTLLRRDGIPIHGVWVSEDGETVRIDFRDEATAQQRDQAEALVAGLDWSEAGRLSWEDEQRRAEAVRHLDRPQDDARILALTELLREVQEDLAQARSLLGMTTREWSVLKQQVRQRLGKGNQ